MSVDSTGVHCAKAAIGSCSSSMDQLDHAEKKTVVSAIAGSDDAEDIEIEASTVKRLAASLGFWFLQLTPIEILHPIF